MKKNNLTTIILMGLLLICGLLLPVSAQTGEYAILIVGDEGSAEMLREEKVLIAEMAKKIRQQSPDQRLPIYSYHFNKERERLYCEKKLNVLAEDLLFVGLVTLKNNVPLKVIYRVDRITNLSRAANDILVRAEEVQAESVQSVAVTPPPTTTTTTTTTTTDPVTVDTPPSTNSSSNEGGFRVQLGSFAQLKYAQDKVSEVTRAELEASIVEASGADGDTLYKVLTPVLEDRTEADSLLERFHEAGFEEAFLTRSE